METPPYLPEHAPPPPPPRSVKSTSARSLILWVILIVLFLTIWQFLSPAERVPSSPPQCVAPCALPSSAWSSTLITLIPLAFLVFLFFLFMRRLQGGNGINA